MSEGINLWGDFPDPNNLRSPLSILREQADALRQMTNGRLDANVEVRNFKDMLHAKLIIVVPALDSFSFSVVEISYGPRMYPVSLQSPFVDDKSIMNAVLSLAKDEEEFIKNLEMILQNHEVRTVITSFIAQAKDNGP